MLSIQTNVNALVAEQNLNVNNQFESQTIDQLTSGYRINSSADDAAGLAVANGYRDNIAELTQGVLNANDGISQLQIIDGGLSNISQMLDRMQTLATESASGTFTGNRATLNNEYQGLIQEIDRQAANIGLNSGGTNNAVLGVYIGGGGTTQSNSEVNVDLSGAGNAVDATSLGVAGTTLLAAGTDFTNPVDLNTVPNGMVLAGHAGGDSQVITVNLAGGTSVQATIQSTSTGGVTVAQAVQQLNDQLSASGITATVDTATGSLMLSGNTAFTASAAATANGTTGLLTSTSTVQNTGDYIANGAASYTTIAGGDNEALTFTNTATGTATTVTLTAGTTKANAVAQLNTQLAGLGIQALLNTAGTGIDFQSTSAFTISKASGAATGGVAGVFAVNNSGNPVAETVNVPSVTGSSTGNALAAVSAVTTAVANLGLTQGAVGAGENKLNYAIDLAQSQITNFSSAESDIRDADIATEAANLSKAQVLQQASIAAMAVANTAPQAVLALLKS